MKYTYRDLMYMLTDFEHLAQPPHPEEKGGKQGSYPRSCYYDEETGKYCNWGNKGLLNGYTRYIRKEGEDEITVDLEGPGVIWRIWRVRADESRLKIWFDDEETPSVDQTFNDFFRKHDNDRGAMNFPNLIETEKSRGCVCWFPIPFQKRIVISGSGFYSYTLFPKDAEMPSFQDRYSRDGCIAKAEIDRTLELRGRFDRRNIDWKYETVTVAPGETVTVHREIGEGAIRAIRWFPELDREQNEEEFMRLMTLSLTWDGRQNPAVWAPIGDFFGSALKIGNFRTYTFGMNDFSCYCNWYMPYSNGMKMELTNYTGRTQTLRFALHITPLPNGVNGDDLLRFHMKWHRDDFKYLNETEFAQGEHRWPDWPLLLAPDVSGRFCGVNLHVYNDLYYDYRNAKSWWVGRSIPGKGQEKPKPNWFWGEGREKFFVDGEKFPSTFGNGTEDYLGYSHSAEPPFPLWDMPFSSVTNIDITGIGHTAQVISHVADNIPFQNKFEGFIEKFKPNEWFDGYVHKKDGPNDNRTYYAATVYWYQDADKDDLYEALPPEELYGFYHLPPRSEK